MKTRLTSPLVAPVEASSMLRFLRRSVIFLSDPRVIFVKMLAYNLTRYCICSSYYWLYVWFKHPEHTYGGFGSVLRTGVWHKGYNNAHLCGPIAQKFFLQQQSYHKWSFNPNFQGWGFWNRTRQEVPGLAHRGWTSPSRGCYWVSIVSPRSGAQNMRNTSMMPSPIQKVCLWVFCRKVEASEVTRRRLRVTGKAEIVSRSNWKTKARGHTLPDERWFWRGHPHVVVPYWRTEKKFCNVIF
jgi:hypothetical protein